MHLHRLLLISFGKKKKKKCGGARLDEIEQRESNFKNNNKDDQSDF